MPIQRLSHLGICVSELEPALRFYRDGLGFRQLSELEIGGEPVDTLLRLKGVDLHAVYLERDGCRIELLHFRAPALGGQGRPRSVNQPGLTHLSLRVSSLVEIVPEIERFGGQLLEDSRIDIPAVEAAAVFVTDPDGTLIELVQSPGDPDLLPGQ